ncbi:nucleoside diphosphate kinase homolog 5-like [Dunckerocampus dactyliophorus]|uniref:nucleoside diphosphate kinase homolog 5-like n=1 Tax=Dunckerocampus dactyliophorus TaxID=161453 RepID=UPI002406D85E|nr:nucleoside diphosphate kinase homolog 5-like [Dunckerocampus dactyliophorus]
MDEKDENQPINDPKMDEKDENQFVEDPKMDEKYGDQFTRVYVERTLAIIKPDAIHKSEEIEDIILTSGFTILQKRKLQLSPEQCSDFYIEHHGRLNFPRLTAYMSSGPILALTLARDNAIALWKSIIGPAKAAEIHPDCLRAKYGTSELQNALHGSDSFHEAEREIKFMFPSTLTVPTKEETEEYLSKYVNQTLLQGLTELCKHKPFNPCVWLADWLLKNNPNKPQICDGALVKEEE